MFNNEGLHLYDIAVKHAFGSLRNSLTIDAFNNLVVCDNSSSSVHVFSLDGKYINSFKKGIVSPWSVATFGDNKLLVFDNIDNLIYVLQ